MNKIEGKLQLFWYNTKELLLLKAGLETKGLLKFKIKKLEEKLRKLQQFNDFLIEDNKRQGDAIEWASNKNVFAHLEHPMSDKEWEYFITELHKRALGPMGSDFEEEKKANDRH